MTVLQRTQDAGSIHANYLQKRRLSAPSFRDRARRLPLRVSADQLFKLESDARVAIGGEVREGEPQRR
jgi:hypothetical protein